MFYAISRYNETTFIITFQRDAKGNLQLAHSYANTLSLVIGDLGITDVWSSYDSVAVKVDPFSFRIADLKDYLSRATLKATKDFKEVEISVRYHHDSPDILNLSENLNLTPIEIHEIHSATVYMVAMIGFLPGFPYLAGLSEKLHIARKSSPSLNVKAGSIAIGGSQTGIYPFDSPGGWYVIGETDISVFEKPDKFLLKPGDKVKFKQL